MGRPEKPIPDDRPMKPVAQYLRDLRARAAVTYRQLAKDAHLSHNALSQIANGHDIRWERVLTFVAALRRHNPAVVTDQDVAELRRRYRDARDHVDLAKNRRVNSRATITRLHQIEVPSTLRSEAVSTRAPGRWNLSPKTDWRRLAKAENTSEIITCLADLVASRGLTERDLFAAEPAERTFSWFSAARRPAVSGTQIRQAVSRQQPYTLEIVIEVVRRCGGTDGDCKAWESAWMRVSRLESLATPHDEDVPEGRRGERLRARTGGVSTSDSAARPRLESVSTERTPSPRRFLRRPLRAAVGHGW